MFSHLGCRSVLKGLMVKRWRALFISCHIVTKQVIRWHVRPLLEDSQAENHFFYEMRRKKMTNMQVALTVSFSTSKVPTNKRVCVNFLFTIFFVITTICFAFTFEQPSGVFWFTFMTSTNPLLYHFCVFTIFPAGSWQRAKDPLCEQPWQGTGNKQTEQPGSLQNILHRI